MPKALERKLKKEALKRFGTTESKRARAYIFGTMMKTTDWRPSTWGKKKKK